MQNELETQYPNLDIQLIGVNALGQDAGIPDATQDRYIPLLQDVDSNADSRGDVWELWNVEWRDVVILDVNSQRVGVLNLTTHDLAEAEDYNTLKNMLLSAAEPTDQTSSISGFVYFDADGNGERGTLESPLSNVEIFLTGTDVDGQPINQSAFTRADGSYVFDGLAAGSYTVRETQPAQTLDGLDSLGSEGGTADDDRFVLTLGDGVHAHDYIFGERGRTAESILLSDFFASTPRDGAVVVFASGSEVNWFSLEGAWKDFSAASVVVSDTTAITVTVTDGNGHQWEGHYPLTEDARVQYLHQQDTAHMVRVAGDLTDVTTDSALPSNAGSGDAEGEAAILENILSFTAMQPVVIEPTRVAPWSTVGLAPETTGDPASDVSTWLETYADGPSFASNTLPDVMLVTADATPPARALATPAVDAAMSSNGVEATQSDEKTSIFTFDRIDAALVDDTLLEPFWF